MPVPAWRRQAPPAGASALYDPEALNWPGPRMRLLPPARRPEQSMMPSSMLHPPSFSVLGEKTIRPVTRQTAPPTAPAPGTNRANVDTTRAKQTRTRFTVDLPPSRPHKCGAAAPPSATRGGSQPGLGLRLLQTTLRDASLADPFAHFSAPSWRLHAPADPRP